MEEMLKETLEGDDEIEEIEAEAEEEVNKVLFEVTNGKLGLAGSVGTELPVRSVLTIVFGVNADNLQSQQDKLDEEETERMERYRQQLNGLLSG